MFAAVDDDRLLMTMNGRLTTRAAPIAIASRVPAIDANWRITRLEAKNAR